MTVPVNPTADLLSDLTARTVETFSQWADANQKVLQALVDLSASNAREGVRLYAEMQSTAVEALKEGRTYLLERRRDLADVGGDPIGAGQQWLLDTVEGAQRSVRLLEGAAEVVTRSGERLRASAERAGREIQTAVRDLTSTPV
jgi:hypothetical protein